ncbi:MAG: hypothetical protein OXF79_30140 [Chloroflexi bacterium]|nr:hypothetical protein [Chloroflexota bacterium]
MYFPPEVTEREFPYLIRRFREITGWSPWQKRLDWLQDGVSKTIAMPHFWRERFELELAFATICKRYKITGRYPRKNLTLDQQRVLSFVSMVVRCHERLSQRGQNRLRGMILDSLKSDYGLAPLAYEMKIAAHLMTRNFGVIFHDLETGGGYDYLAVKDDMRIEIECKFVSGDIGRQIHLKRLHQFGEYVTPKLHALLSQVSGGLLVQLTIPGRLHGQESQHASIAEQLSHAITLQEREYRDAGNEISISKFDLENSPFATHTPQFLSKNEVDQFVFKTFGVNNKNMLIMFRPHRHAVIVVLQSAKEERVLTGIHRQLKGSARQQFTGCLPAVLCCHLADLQEHELSSLQHKDDDAVGLNYMTSDLIIRRPQLLAVTYTAPGRLVNESVLIGNMEQQSHREQGAAYTIRNPNHSFAQDARYILF